MVFMSLKQRSRTTSAPILLIPKNGRRTQVSCPSIIRIEPQSFIIIRDGPLRLTTIKMSIATSVKERRVAWIEPNCLI
jgi:hypothetical protein